MIDIRKLFEQRLNEFTVDDDGNPIIPDPPKRKPRVQIHDRKGSHAWEAACHDGPCESHTDDDIKKAKAYAHQYHNAIAPDLDPNHPEDASDIIGDHLSDVYSRKFGNDFVDKVYQKVIGEI